MATQGKIWVNMRTKGYTHGGGTFKTAVQADYVSGVAGFDFAQVQSQLPSLNPTEIAPNCVIIMIKVPTVGPGTVTDGFMKTTADELELQSRFAVDGYALPILGFIATSNHNVFIEQYGVANILASIRAIPFYPPGSIDGCYVLMLKCGFNKNRNVMKLFDSPPIDKQVIVDSVIDFIDYTVEVQNLILYDFKPPNACRDPVIPGKMVGLDFDTKFCIRIPNITSRKGSIAKAYMFLMFACFEYQFGTRDPAKKIKITIALYNGLLRLRVNELLDVIVTNQICVNLFKHYLHLNPQFSAIEVRDILRHRYIGTIAAQAGVSVLSVAAAKAPQWSDP